MEFDRLVIGCGYLGTRVAARWSAAGLRVAALTRSEENADRFRAAGWHPVQGDVTDPTTLEVLPPAAAVLWAVGFDRRASAPQRAVYVDGLANVSRVMRGRAERFVYISSTSVYGQNEGEWVDEDSETRPVTEGGRLCLEAEAVLAADPWWGSRHSVLRLAGIYGPGRLLTRIEQLRAGEPLTGSPDAWLNLIHVDDGAAAVEAAAVAGASARWLVTDDEPLTRGAYYGRLAELAGAPPARFDAGQPSRRGSGGLNKRCRNGRLKAGLLPRLSNPRALDALPTLIPDSVPSSEPMA